jgi:hypothetical protein
MNQEEKLQAALRGVLEAQTKLSQAREREKMASNEVENKEVALADAHSNAVRVIRSTGKRQVLWGKRLYTTVDDRVAETDFDGIIIPAPKSQTRSNS